MLSRPQNFLSLLSPLFLFFSHSHLHLHSHFTYPHSHLYFTSTYSHFKHTHIIISLHQILHPTYWTNTFTSHLEHTTTIDSHITNTSKITTLFILFLLSLFFLVGRGASMVACHVTVFYCLYQNVHLKTFISRLLFSF